jgi:hypothetical protein
VASDACPEPVASFAWDDEESVARGAHGVSVAVVSALYG